MPNTKSAKKRFKQSEVRRERNRATRSTLKTLVKKVRASVAAKNMDGSVADFRNAARKLDRAAARGVIHKNTAARTKSRLHKLLKKASQAK